MQDTWRETDLLDALGLGALEDGVRALGLRDARLRVARDARGACVADARADCANWAD